MIERILYVVSIILIVISAILLGSSEKYFTLGSYMLTMGVIIVIFTVLIFGKNKLFKKK